MAMAACVTPVSYHAWTGGTGHTVHRQAVWWLKRCCCCCCCSKSITMSVAKDSLAPDAPSLKLLLHMQPICNGLPTDERWLICSSICFFSNLFSLCSLVAIHSSDVSSLFKTILMRPVISEFTGLIFTKFTGLVDKTVEMISRTFVVRSLKHRRNLRGVPVPPTFWSGGYRTPHFLGVWQKKITATFPQHTEDTL